MTDSIQENERTRARMGEAVGVDGLQLFLVSPVPERYGSHLGLQKENEVR